MLINDFKIARSNVLQHQRFFFSAVKAAAFIINETRLRQLGGRSAEEALCKSINLEGERVNIIGVLKDFQHQLLQNPIQGTVPDIDQPIFTQRSVKL